jgi:hypothetical protein
MHIILGVALGMVVVAPFLGRWRAKAWLNKNALVRQQQLTPLSRPELREPSV